MGLFLAFGTTWTALAGAPGTMQRDADSDPSRDARACAEPLPEARLPEARLPDAAVWLLDGFNVLQAALLTGEERAGGIAWWGPDCRARLLLRAARFQPGERIGEGREVWVVFDGERPADPDLSSRDPSDPSAGSAPGCVRTVFAPSADEWLVRRVRTAAEPRRLAIVTADRKLAGRARHHGAHVVPPRRFLACCAAAPERCAAAPEGGGDQTRRS